MTSESLFVKKPADEFISESNYLGIAISSNAKLVRDYVDLEHYFLSATYQMSSARIAEGFLCWLMRYGHLLSPSKIRRLLKSSVAFDPSVLGAFVSYMEEHKINNHQLSIIRPYTKKRKTKTPLLPGPTPKKLNPHFAKYNIQAHDYKLVEDKFLQPISHVLHRCTELRNRALFGSTVNADVASFLKWHPNATPYQIAKFTGNHKASVFKVFDDIKLAI